MGEAIEQSGGHFGVTKDRSPFTEAEVGGDDDAGALVEPAEEVEEQGAGGAERQVAELVEDDEVGAREALGDLTAMPFAFSCSSVLTSSTVEKKRTYFR